MYHYAGNNPIKYTDPTGEAIETIWDIGLTIYDIFSAISKSIKGDHSGWGDVALDAASILIPGVPAGLSKVDDVVKFSKNSDKIAVGVTSSYNAIKKGPLPEALAKTFRSGSYSEVILESDTVLYRVYGGNSGKFGQFWTRTKPFGPLQSQIDLALKPEWGNTAENIVSIKVPKGTTIFEGVAESQGYGLVGGGNQIIIPKVDQNWELP